MLNPERCDIDGDIAEIGFTDSEGDEVVVVRIKKRDAWQLSKMIREKVGYKR